MSHAIDLSQITKDYPDPDGEPLQVLAVPALRLKAGEELAIAGPSGAGKTTLFNIIAGLLKPTSGSVSILGTAIHTLSEPARDQFRARNIGYVFQTSNLLAGFSALENVLLAMGFAGVISPAQRQRRAQELLEQVGLASRLKHRPAQLSSGQQQRVALARALANRPTLILADEPTAHVDQRTSEHLMRLLRTYCADERAALLLASHDRELLATAPQIFQLTRPGDFSEELLVTNDCQPTGTLPVRSGVAV